MSNGKSFSLQDIADKAGVSKTTVSFTLNGSAAKYKISQKTQDRILEVVKKYNYQPNPVARSLRLGSSSTLGLVVPDLDNPFFNALTNHLEYFASQAGYHLIVASTHDDEKKEQEALHNYKNMLVDGIILSSVLPNTTVDYSIPVVLIDRRSQNPNHYYVVSENKEASYHLTTHLIQSGANRIVYIGGVPDLPTNLERVAGYTDALGDHNISYSKVLGDAFTRESGFQAAEQLFDDPTEFDAIYTASYKILEGVLSYVKQNQIDLSAILLATFDDHPLLDFLTYPVCSVRQDVYKIAQSALEIFLQITQKEKRIESKAVPTHLINRF